MTRTATTDLGIIPTTKAEVLEGLMEHIGAGFRVFAAVMDNGDTAYVVPECKVGENNLYVKVKFFQKQEIESMLVISAHPPRRWC
jgi:hypothetical protein